MSIMGNIIRVPRQVPLPRLRPRQWLLRLQCGAASAADARPSKRDFDGIAAIGEQVRRLRTSCTGQKPVHFFLNATAVAAGALLAAAPLAPADAAAARPAPGAATGVAHSVDD